MDGTFLYLVGTAGCGKSCLASALAIWMQEEGHAPALVNLDPGAEGLPYEPNVDIREWVSVRGMMDEHGLGPNGAQIAAADLLALNTAGIVDVMDGMEADYFIVDTPGQIELFAFRSSSNVIVDAFGRERALLAFLFDPNLVRQPTGFVSAQMLAATVEFRLGLPTLNVLAKTDLLGAEELELVNDWASEPMSLISALDSEPGAPHLPLTNELVKVIESLGMSKKLIASSSETGEGVSDIYSAAQMIFDGGEDLERRPKKSR
ncbi:MAG: ATP/GTP-binding protein [Methanobacteriota archaeon]